MKTVATKGRFAPFSEVCKVRYLRIADLDDRRGVGAWAFHAVNGCFSEIGSTSEQVQRIHTPRPLFGDRSYQLNQRLKLEPISRTQRRDVASAVVAVGG